MRVLIVDDYPGLIELYDLALRARGFDVVGATTAGEAMTLAATQRFDAVVLDIELPDGTGPELGKRMRAIPSLQSAKFVGMSSYESNEIGNPFDAFIPKPFHPKRLASLLRKLIAQKPPEPARNTAA
jgi:DNA-binding response OmpR family regulator